MSFFLLTSYSCHKEEDIILNSDGAIVKQPALWSTSLSKDKLLSYNMGVSIIYDNQVLTMGAEAGLKGGISISGVGNDYLLMKDLTDGRDLWKWDDQWSTAESGDIPFVYQYNQYLTYTNGSRIYGIDLSTGQTLWKKQDMEQYDLRPLGLGTSYFVTADIKDDNPYWEYAIFEGDMRTGKQELVVYPKYQSLYKAKPGPVFKYCHLAMPFLQNQDTLLSIVYQEVFEPAPPYPYTDRVQNYLALYNKTQKAWVYDRIVFTEPGVSEVLDGVPILSDGLIYHSINRTITCHEVLTGKLVWKRTFGGNFLFSGFIKVGNKILANNEGTYLYALNAQTGGDLWQVKSPGTCTRMQELNGVVYYVGGGDGLLYAVDSDTGTVYWKIVSPDKKSDSRAFFYNMCSVAPGINGGKGKVIVSSGLNAFCYEAVR
ncbi:MAG: PQQ-binding-like beta-propeller repeat protein [Bacteroidota bacterium]